MYLQLLNLRMWQLNLNRSNIAQNAFLHTISRHDADILLLQEPYINPLNSLTTSTFAWRVVYPIGHHDWPAKGQNTRSVILISTRLPTDTWEQTPVQSPDITAIRLSMDGEYIHVFNIYNDQGHDRTLQTFQTATSRQARRREERNNINNNTNTNNRNYVLWAGDFDRYHPLSELDSYQHLLGHRYRTAAEPLITLLADFGMQQILPGGIPTLEALATGDHTRPDNIFANSNLADHMVACKVTPVFRPRNTDHYPIAVTLDFTLQRNPTVTR